MTAQWYSKSPRLKKSSIHIPVRNRSKKARKESPRMNISNIMANNQLSPFLGGALVLGMLVGWLLERWEGRSVKGMFFGLLGPLGQVIFLQKAGPVVRCFSCGSNTPWYPKPMMKPGMSEPHLRCRHCHEIILGEWSIKGTIVIFFSSLWYGHKSPAGRLNKFCYHNNWLKSLLLSASLGGLLSWKNKKVCLWSRWFRIGSQTRRHDPGKGVRKGGCVWKEKIGREE